MTTIQRTVLIVLLAAMATGCKNQQYREKVTALYAQNQALQDQLTQCHNAYDAEQQRSTQMAGQIAQLQSELQAARAAPPAAPVQYSQEEPATTAFENIPGVETDANASRITVRVPGDVLFDPGKVALKNSARSTLERVAGVITREYSGNTIRVVGHTDSDPIRKSKWEDNLELSLERAATVHRYLQEQGVDPDRMEAVGMGPWEPRSSKAQSRRVEIIVVLEQ